MEIDNAIEFAIKMDKVMRDWPKARVPTGKTSARELKQWLDESCQDSYFWDLTLFRNDIMLDRPIPDHYYPPDYKEIMFENIKDAVRFKMRWS